MNGPLKKSFHTKITKISIDAKKTDLGMYQQEKNKGT